MSLVSIIMPYFKKESFLKDTIDSLICQSYQNFEIILIDDELSNQSKKFLESIKKIDDRIKIIFNEKNIGAGLSRNRGINFANGEYIAFCDCDDLWIKTKLEEQLNFMKINDSGFSYTAYKIIDKNGQEIGSRKAEIEMSYSKLIKSCDIGLSTVILKKKFFDKDKYCFANLKTKEDFVFWIRLSRSGLKMLGLNKELSSWRKLDNSLSSSLPQKLLDGFKVYNLYLKYNIFKSFFYLLILSFNFLKKK